MPRPRKASQGTGQPRILVMRYRFIGDTLLTVPFLRNLRRQYPEATIDMLVGPNSGELLTHCPYVDELIYFDTTRKHRYENTESAPGKTFLHYASLLKQRRYDQAFVLKRSLSSAVLAALAGIPERVGFDTECRGFLLTKKVPYRADCHEIEAFLDVLRAVDVPIRDTHLESWWTPAETQKAESLMAPFAGRENIVLHLTSSNPAKQWTDEAALALTTRLLQEDGRITLHALGARSDRGLYEALRAQLPEGLRERWHVWCGELSLLESMALLSKMSLVAGVDSGTLHMAVAVGVPVVALFGPMNETRWAPPGASVVANDLPCRPCNLKITCAHAYPCMKEMSAETVYRAVRQSLEQRSDALLS